MGHEMVGTVAEVGPEVKNLALGDRVTVDPQRTCGVCPWCDTGQHHLCRSKTVLGTTNWSGALGEIISAPASRVYRLPDHLNDLQATLIEPVAVGVHAVTRAQLEDGQTAVILGSGPIGLVTAAVASAYGASKIVTVDLMQHCLDVSLQMGATETVVATEGKTIPSVLEKVGSQGADIVFVAVGIQQVFDTALQLVKPTGKVVLIALFEDVLKFAPFSIVGNDVSLVGSQMYHGGDIQKAIDLIGNATVNPLPMVSHELTIDDAQEGFVLAASKADNAIKVCLSHSG